MTFIEFDLGGQLRRRQGELSGWACQRKGVGAVVWF